MGKIKVLHVNKLYAPHIGGIEKVVQDIAEGLHDLIDIKVLVCQPKGRTIVDNINHVEVTRAGSLGIFFSMPLSLSFFRHLRKLSKDRDVIHFHMPFPLGDAAYFFSGFKGKVVVWWHSDIIRQRLLLKIYLPLMDKFLKRADCIIVATEGHINGSSYLRKYRDKCMIIPYGIDVQTFTNEAINHDIKALEKNQEDVSDFSAFGNTNHKNLIKLLYIGRLVYYKGVDILLSAFCHIHGAVLCIAGDGPLRDQLKQQALKLGISENVIFTGNSSDNQIKNLLKDCDMLILPSVANSEAFGLVQLEAMAFAKPVINTSLPTGVPHVSINEETGLTVPPDDPISLSQAIQRLIDNADQRKQFGYNAKKRVLERFLLKDMLETVYKLYQDLLT